MNKKIMNGKLFNELVESIREGGAILRGEKEPSRSFVVETPDVRHIREGFQLSQAEFAALLGISLRTLQNWDKVGVYHKEPLVCCCK